MLTPDPTLVPDPWWESAIVVGVIFVVFIIVVVVVIKIQDVARRGRWSRPEQHECKPPRIGFHHVGDQWTCATCDLVREVTLISDGGVRPFGRGGYRRGWKIVGAQVMKSGSS